MHMQWKTIVIFFNGGAGQKDRSLKKTIVEVLSSHGRKVVFIRLRKKHGIPRAHENLIRRARKSKSLIVAAGGDGTVNFVAGYCNRYNAPMGILPLGTFNYFARDLHIPTDLQEALHTLIRGKIRKVALGRAQDTIFLNNASFGLYTRLIKRREQLTFWLGRLRIVGAVSAALSFLEWHKGFTIRFISHKKEMSVHTSMVFIGNNSFQLSNLGLNIARCTKQGMLAVAILKPITRLEKARLLFRGLIRNWREETRLEQFCISSFEVESKRQEIELVLDGEIVKCKTPLSFTVEPNALSVIVPAERKRA